MRRAAVGCRGNQSCTSCISMMPSCSSNGGDGDFDVNGLANVGHSMLQARAEGPQNQSTICTVPDVSLDQGACRRTHLVCIRRACSCKPGITSSTGSTFPSQTRHARARCMWQLHVVGLQGTLPAEYHGFASIPEGDLVKGGGQRGQRG